MPIADFVSRLRATAAHLPGHALLAWIGRYTAHPDPRVKIANSVATIVVGNQPFYPLYLCWILGAPGAIGLWTWLTMPFFAAVPALARGNANAGRALMIVTGLANTILTAKLLGVASGVGWFALPCAALAIACFHAREWRLAGMLLALCGLAGLALLRLGGPPVLCLDAPALASLTKLHLVSVGSLLIVIAYMRIRAK